MIEHGLQYTRRVVNDVLVREIQLEERREGRGRGGGGGGEGEGRGRGRGETRYMIGRT